MHPDPGSASKENFLKPVQAPPAAAPAAPPEKEFEEEDYHESFDESEEFSEEISEPVVMNEERREALKSLAVQLLELREMVKNSQVADESFRLRKY